MKHEFLNDEPVFKTVELKVILWAEFLIDSWCLNFFSAKANLNLHLFHGLKAVATGMPRGNRPPYFSLFRQLALDLKLPRPLGRGQTGQMTGFSQN
jgi:hypothetical protein